MAPPARAVLCPYCRVPLQWMPSGELAGAIFSCDRCGEFPDFGRPPQPVSLSRPSQVTGSAAHRRGAPRRRQLL